MLAVALGLAGLASGTGRKHPQTRGTNVASVDPDRLLLESEDTEEHDP